MKESEKYSSLFLEFPELLSDDRNLHKEVLSHFGLLFSQYAQLEASIHNFYIFYQLKNSMMTGKIKTKQDWLILFEKYEQKAFSATLGSLINFVSDCDEMSPLIDNLRSINKTRNYFAHHFFREESPKLFSEPSSLHLINGINQVRNDVTLIEEKVEAITDKLMESIYGSSDFKKSISNLCDQLEEEFTKIPTFIFGWEK
ncbi:hypothetical protein [Pararhodospirillum photometricum]|uniref:hypothetical protein n=1 Tax=Pararhodospirillum photometricum TaxID=1084 RepID=UPI0012FF3F9C|nr:hypothetical protein [Pararhodospirillum photometricum]